MEWNGYKLINFTYEGHTGVIVLPEKVAEGKPWVWRTEFFGAFPSVDLALVKAGWHIASYSVSDQYGCPAAIAQFKKFHDFIVSDYQLSSQAALFGFSRGGLYAVNYAAAYPEDVASLYLDAPVLDIRSWPGGWLRGNGSPREWEDCKRIYNLNTESAKTFAGNPLDKMDALLEAKIPVIVVAGDADKDVPYEENGAVFVENYQRKGGKIEVIVKNGCAHHPHSLENPTPVVDFLQIHK